jgi:hypothetical protein
MEVHNKIEEDDSIVADGVRLNPSAKIDVLREF